ncbi:DUF6676 family protein [Nocardia sp. BMG111209]|uniref:Rv1476 family membrane protein n=1 Tax=Nocardia sp. BMG111209 TaxID=1160137 RepID=UPI000374A0A8|nr:DUF6676 family protein [Nocardia sp. BMG111209]
MTASHTSVLIPMAVELPPNVDLSTIVADLADDHVSVPAGKDDTQLVQIAADARAHGIQLNIVVVPGNPGRDSDLRDLATEVGKQTHGTVVVLSDDWVGTYSDAINRSRLEWAEDTAKYRGGHSADAAQVVVSRLETPDHAAWTAFTGVVLAGAVVTIGGLYIVKARRAARERG